MKTSGKLYNSGGGALAIEDVRRGHCSNTSNRRGTHTHEDEGLLRQLETHWSLLKRHGVILTWYERARKMSEDAPEGKRPRFMAVRHLKDVRLNLQVQITQLEALGELYEAQEEFARVAAALGRALEATIVVLKTLQEEA